MKKLLACLLVVILAFSMTLLSVSAATASPEAEGIVSSTQAVDKDNNPVSLELDKIDGKVTPAFQAELKKLQAEVKDNSLKVVAQYDAKILGNPEYPVTATFNVLGISNTSKVYVLVDGVALAAKVENGKITFTIDKPIKTLAIVTDKTTAANVEKENNVVSPQTGSSLAMAAIVAVLSLGFTLVVYKKVKA